MLVLSRREQQAIEIRKEEVVIRITVVKLKNGSVQLGFEAPQDYAIKRAELNSR